MGIKEIFKEGSSEFKRRSELAKVKRTQKEKTKLYEDQLITLGKKAWESQVNIAQFGETETLINTTQQQLDELGALQTSVETQKKETEAQRIKENESFETQRKEVEAKKKEVDTRLEEERKALKEAQKTSDNAKNRLTQILKEEESLNKKLAEVQTPEPEKTTIREKLAAFPAEQGALEQKKKETWDTIAQLNQSIIPIEAESTAHQKEIDRIRNEQKAALAELDKSVAALKTKLQDTAKKITESNNEQANNFKQLGGQLTATGSENAAVAPELTAVQTSVQEINTLNADIERLENLGTGQSRGALWKMIGLIVAAVAIVVALIILITWLLKPKNQISTPFGNIETSQSADEMKQSIQQNPADALKNLAEATGELKKASEKMQGGKITVADKDTMLATLPAVGGWQMSEPSYGRTQFGQMDSSSLSAIYKNADSRQVEISITDAGNSAAILAGVQLFFSMNIAKEDENGYEKVSNYNNTPMIEKYEKQSKRAHLTFIVKKRYIIALNATGDDSINVLKQFIPGFNLSKLQ